MADPTGPHVAMDGGSEVLVLDRDERVREALGKLLTSSGLMVTASGDAERMIALASEKFFAAALVDVDTPDHEKGFQILPRLKKASAATRLVLLTSRQTFDVATRGFHAGAVDVVAKAPDSVGRLVEEVVKLCKESAGRDSDQVLHEALQVHELFLKKLMESSRRAQQAEEHARGESGRFDLKECVVLVVDENPRTAAGLQEALGRTAPYRCVAATNGGEALDLAGQQKYQLALVNAHLPDLTLTTVVKSLRSQLGDAIVMVFSHPGPKPGHLKLVDEHKEIMLIPELMHGDQLVSALQEMREAYLAKSRERHYLQAFRNEHYEFLKRYVELRQKLIALAPRMKP
jgi:two-component system, OmpR family, response regulator